MFFLDTPQDPNPIYYDPEAAFEEYRRRAYIKQLQEKLQREQFERELQLEQERHWAALDAIARKEKARRQQVETQATQMRGGFPGRYAQPRLAQYQQSPRFGGARLPQRPSPQEILARRLARQREEEERSRQFHQNILSQIFGISPEELAYNEEEEEQEQDEEEIEPEPRTQIPAPTRQPAPVGQSRPRPIRKPSVPTQTPVTVHPPATTYTYALPARQQTHPTRQPVPAAIAEPTPLPTTTKAPEAQQTTEAIPETEEDATVIDEPLPEMEDVEPHWSAAPQRAQALAAISAIDRSFAALKATFVFPSGQLERLPNSDAPKLAYNATNASIHAYEHALSELLGRLDDIESHGFKGVREARKQLIVRIEKELEDLDKKIAETLAGSEEKAASIPTEVPAAAVAPAKEPEDVEMKDEAPKEIPALANVTAATPSLFKEDTPKNEPVEYPTITPSPAPGAVPKDATDIATETVVESTQTEPSKPVAGETKVTDPALVALPESTSDEEEEIADACLSDDEKEAGKEKAHDSAEMV